MESILKNGNHCQKEDHANRQSEGTLNFFLAREDLNGRRGLFSVGLTTLVGGSEVSRAD